MYKHKKKLLLVLGVILISVVGGTISSTFVVAQGAAQGEWLDKVNITYDGKQYRDRNPYDDTNHWVVPDSGGCGNEMTVEDYGRNGTVANVKIRADDGAGNCNTTSEKSIRLGSAGRRDIAGYRVNDTTLFTPIGIKEFGCTVASKVSSISETTRSFFQNPPADSGVGETTYYKVNSGGGTRLNDKIKVFFNDDDATARVSIDSCSATFEMNITIGQVIPELYGINPDTPLPGGSDDADQEAEDDNACDVQMNNPLSWILCPVIVVLEEGVNRFFNAANNALNFTIDSSQSDIKTAWEGIRNIANILFVISFLVIIISQALVGKL